jgi:hypothetical protein
MPPLNTRRILASLRKRLDRLDQHVPGVDVYPGAGVGIGLLLVKTGCD